MRKISPDASSVLKGLVCRHKYNPYENRGQCLLLAQRDGLGNTTVLDQQLRMSKRATRDEISNWSLFVSQEVKDNTPLGEVKLREMREQKKSESDNTD